MRGQARAASAPRCRLSASESERWTLRVVRTMLYVVHCTRLRVGQVDTSAASRAPAEYPHTQEISSSSCCKAPQRVHAANIRRRARTQAERYKRKIRTVRRWRRTARKSSKFLWCGKNSDVPSLSPRPCMSNRNAVDRSSGSAAIRREKLHQLHCQIGTPWIGIRDRPQSDARSCISALAAYRHVKSAPSRARTHERTQHSYADTDRARRRHTGGSLRPLAGKGRQTAARDCRSTLTRRSPRMFRAS